MVYFVTLALGVAMFYAFNALQDQSLFKYFEEAYAQRLSILFDTLGGLNKFIAFIFGLIILYATSYLLRKRKKEFGLYMILGMNKLKISTILVLETFFIGLFSLVVGIVLGIGLSQLINIFLGHLFVADISRLTLSISMHAIIQTLINFGIIYLVAMVFSVILMNRAKLIDLLKASQQNEKSWWQKPWIGTLLFISGLAILTWSYYIATHLMDVIIDLQWGPKMILYSIFGGIIGTYFTFMGIAAFIPVVLPKFKGFLLSQTA
ncbi:ABC transporter permease [Enterococcus cecorum]